MAEKNESPGLPAYRPPSKGWLSRVPPSIQPYVQLMRLDRPGGLTYFFLPHLYGVLHAGIIVRARPAQLARTILIPFDGTILMRGATVTWNDIVDAPFDRKVARTRHRAIARGAVYTRSALFFTDIQSMLALAFILPLPAETAQSVIPSIAAWFLYPLMKQVMDYPQMAMGATSSTELYSVFTTYASQDPVQLSIITLFAANAAWTVCYETMYSYQDVREDAAAGVRSLALIVREPMPAKVMLSVMAVAQVGLLTATGRLMGFGVGSAYFAGSVLGMAAALAVKLRNVDLEDPASCWWWFARGGLITGTAMLSGLLVEYVARV